MRHVLLTLAVLWLPAGCAVVDMPMPDGENPQWVEDRLDRAGDGRQAPAVVPVTSIPAEEAAAMDEATRSLLDERAAMEAEARRRDASDQRGSAEDFITEGQTRTQPPQN